MSENLEVRLGGKTYTATYSVRDGIVEVRTTFGSKSTQVGGSPAEVIARIVAKELLTAAKVRGELD